MSFTVTRLPAISFTENIIDYVLSEVDAPVFLSVDLAGNRIVTDMELTADANKQVVIHTRQLTRHLQALARPESVTEPLPLIEITTRKADESLMLSGYLLPGGVSAGKVSDMIDFLRRNFLTWQPQIIETTRKQPQWLAFVRPSTLFPKFELHSVLHTADGRNYTKQIEPTPEAHTYCQVDTSFSALWEAFCEEKNLAPLSYDVYGEHDQKLVIPDHLPQTLHYSHRPFDQRYILRPARQDDTCFGFANTLGGFDTLMMRGPVMLKPEGEIKTFTSNETEEELFSGYTSFWEASTGYIDSERMAAQYQDFLKSTSRWIYRAGEWKRIVVDEYKLEHTPRELNAYTFKYHLAERDERRYQERTELPEVELPTIL